MARELEDEEDTMTDEEKKWLLEDVSRTAAAFAEIEKSPNLRFLFRELLSACGEGRTPYAETATETARLCGRYEILTELRAEMSLHSQSLYSSLIQETDDETISRYGR